MRLLMAELLLLAALPWDGICDDNSVVEWMRSNAIRLQTAEAGRDLADMEPLKRMIGDARIVALGDATRGTHEFFELRHRMLEFLATEMGFTVFAMEANMPETQLLNEFIQHGTGDPAALLRGTRLWTLDTREMIDLIKWMRDFNQSGKGRLEVAGFDMMAPDMALKNVREFVGANDPGYIAAVDSASDQARTATTTAAGPNFGYATGTFPASEAAGKRVRLSGYIKTKGVTRGEASLYWRVEGPTGAVTFESLQGRGATGTADWKLYQVELAVPADARNVTFCALHNGDGWVWFNSLAIELDGVPYLKKDRFDLDFELVKGFDIGGNRYAVRRDAKESHNGKQSLQMRYLSAEPPTIVDPDYIFGIDRNSVDPRFAAFTWKQVVERLEQTRESYRAKNLPEREIDWAIQSARIVTQCMQWRSGEAGRDGSMAENVKWILDHSKGAKVVVWSTNGHVAAGGFGDDLMGALLRKMFGEHMIVFGFAFNQGSFQAQDQGKVVKDFTVPPAPAGSLDATLAATGIPLFALDLRQAPKAGPVAEWLRETHKSRNVGPSYLEDRAALYMLDLIAPQCFDAILFVEKSTAPHKRLRRR